MTDEVFNKLCTDEFPSRYKAFLTIIFNDGIYDEVNPTCTIIPKVIHPKWNIFDYQRFTGDYTETQIKNGFSPIDQKDLEKEQVLSRAKHEANLILREGFPVIDYELYLDDGTFPPFPPIELWNPNKIDRILIKVVEKDQD